MKVRVKYQTSVFVQAGWRSADVTALAETISAKRAKVLEVLDINGDGNTGYSSLTGANRQKYSVSAIAARETGKIKILSKCLSWEEIND